jgi:hypothetical protein
LPASFEVLTFAIPHNTVSQFEEDGLSGLAIVSDLSGSGGGMEALVTLLVEVVREVGRLANNFSPLIGKPERAATTRG